MAKYNSMRLIVDRKYRALIPDFKTKDVIDAVVKVLDPFNELTDLLSGEKKCYSFFYSPSYDSHQAALFVCR